MAKNITITVLQKHINKGNQGQANTCAIALALVDEFDLDLKEVQDNTGSLVGGYDEYRDYVVVSPETIKVHKTNGFSFNLVWKELPSSISNFIGNFDDDKKDAKPFKFKLPFLK